VYDLLGHRQRYHGYRAYVEAGIDDDLEDLYDRDRTAAVMGDEAFRTWVRERPLQEVDDNVFVAQVLPNTLSMTRINQLVAEYDKVEATRLTTVVKGPKKGLLARKVAMYLCQQLGGSSLTDIMRTFGLSHVGSVSFITTQIRKRSQANTVFSTTLQRMKRYIIKHAT